MERIVPFDAQHLEAACRVLADPTRGLTGPQIGQILQDMRIADVSPEMTKWKRFIQRTRRGAKQASSGQSLDHVYQSCHEPGELCTR